MKDEILSNPDNPWQLKRLYRADKQSFKRAFKTLYPEVQSHSVQATDIVTKIFYTCTLYFKELLWNV